MREHLFRGFNVCENGTQTIVVNGNENKGEWFCGSLLKQSYVILPGIKGYDIIDGKLHTDGINYFILLNSENIKLKVIPETVGEYTGLTDKNGTKIFEGDIMQLCSATYPCIVYWDGIGWAWTVNKKRRDIDLTREKMEVIGNIFNTEVTE